MPAPRAGARADLFFRDPKNYAGGGAKRVCPAPKESEQGEATRGWERFAIFSESTKRASIHSSTALKNHARA